MSDKPPQVPIEYGPDSDDEDDGGGLETSKVQVALLPIFAVLLGAFIVTASIPFIFMYTVWWMGVQARSDTATESRSAMREERRY
jgi:hypothetical protein